MNMIAERITGIVLHVSDQNIVPVDHVERTIRSKLQVNRTEIAIL
jgi:hypothetical protein